MPEPPYFDGREPLTAELMNEMVEAARRHKKVSACPPLEAHQLGSSGTLVRLGAAVGTQSVGNGFWAILTIDEEEGTATWEEAIPARDPASGIQTLAAKPGGRSGSINPLCALLQGIGNLRPFREAAYNAIRLSSVPTAPGQFTFAVGGIGSYSAATVSGIATPAEFETALNASTTPDWQWRVTGVAGEVYRCAILNDDPEESVRRRATIAITGNTTGVTITSLVEDAFSDGSGVSALYNVLPGGQAVWVRPMVDPAGDFQYVFGLPYVGMWARIDEGEFRDGVWAYPFIEQLQSTTAYNEANPSASAVPSLYDDPTGITGYAYEVNGDENVAPDSRVWLTPVWRAGAGVAWTFASANDFRILAVPLDTTTPEAYPSGTNCKISYPRGQDVKGAGAYAFLDSDVGLSMGTYLGLRTGNTAGGYPLYKHVGGGASSGWSGTLSVDQAGTTYTLTVTNGRIVTASP